jgi:hypothetical protein
MMQWATAERLNNVKDALWYAQAKIPHLVVQETGMAV